jgi:AAA family ATP:ADP antiporter
MRPSPRGAALGLPRDTIWCAEILAPAAVLFGIMLAHALLETARDALFLARIGPHWLALAYVAIAATALLAITAVRRWAGVRDPRRILIGFLAAAVVGTTALAAAIGIFPSAVFVLYVWTGLVATLVVPCFWTVLDRGAHAIDIKRIFTAVGAGGVLGALVGSLLAAGLARVIETRHLVTAGALAFALATIIAGVFAPRPRGDAEITRGHRADAVAPLRRSRRLIRALVVLALVSTVALTIGDLTFKRVVAERLPADQLAQAFGAIYAALNVVGLIVQLAIAPRLLAGLGVGGTLTVLPVALVGFALGFALTGATLAILALKLADGGLRNSAHRVGSEILFLPVPAQIRDGSKPIADAIGQRGGQALAALLVFATASVAGARTLALIAAIAGFGWLVALTVARRAYVSRFREMLRSGEVRREVRVPALDRESVEVLTESLASPDEVEALAALDLLIRYGGPIPSLALYHPDHRVVRRALEVLGGQDRPEITRVVGRLLEHADPEIRAITLAAAHRNGGDRGVLANALADPHPAVRAAALVCLADDPDDPASLRALEVMAAGTTADRVALARAIGLAPSPRFRGILHELLAGEPGAGASLHDGISRADPAVIREVLQVFERSPTMVDLEPLIAALANAHVRADVRRVLLAIGAPALDRLIAALDDPATPLLVRQHLPRTISRFRSRTAVAALVARLPHEPDATAELKLLRAVGRMRADDPALAIDAPGMRAYARRVVREAARYATLADHLDADDAPAADSELLGELVREKRRHAVERVFRALGIMFPRSDMRSVHDAFVSNDRSRRNAAREIIDDLVPIELRVPLIAIVDDLPPDQRRARLGELAPGPFSTHEQLFVFMLSDRSHTLRCVVAHHVAERRLTGLRADLERLRPALGSPFVTGAFDQAIARLAHA